MKKVELTASVRHQGAPHEVATFFSVFLGKDRVASGKISGSQYTAAEVLDIFKQNPTRFHKWEAFDLARQCGYFKTAA